MKVLIVILLGLALFIIALVLSRVTITAQYLHKYKKDYLTIRVVAVFGLVTKTFMLPEALIEKHAEDILKEEQLEAERKEKRSSFYKKLRADAQVVGKWLHFFNKSKHVTRKFLKKMIVHELSWDSTIGAGDAALTGKLTGAVWSVKGIVQMLAYQFLTVRCKPIFNLTPVFNGSIIQTEFYCIFSIRVGDAILTAVQLLRYWKKGNRRLPSSITFKTNKTVYQEE